MDELSPLLADVLNRFITNQLQGGMPACRQMVTDLAAEMEAVRAIEGATEDINMETIMAQGDLGDEEIGERFKVTLGITDAFIDAMTRHSFASWLLGVAEETHNSK